MTLFIVMKRKETLLLGSRPALFSHILIVVALPLTSYICRTTRRSMGLQTGAAQLSFSKSQMTRLMSCLYATLDFSTTIHLRLPFGFY
ncbi:hypothetical protein BS78_K183100 [Paspalum vaginatum]|uniref:Uncharacterized protein n=1 Tax=Paspalum vaginatum TaxID=158149 RepID=A0A9W7XEJ8_9POAL|nr:hypothetical protein BS78_K183100 [Paspalum vaginatum]